MPLIWTPVISVANWEVPPAPPKVVRAAIEGIGWLVASEVAGGWSTTFVPNVDASDPDEDARAQKFQAAQLHWQPPTQAMTAPPVKAEPAAPDPRKKQKKK
jgi:hypothetical protein